MSSGPSGVPDGLSDAEKERVKELVVMVNRLESKVDDQADRLDELEAENQAKDAKIEAQARKIENLQRALAGDPYDFMAWDFEERGPIDQRIRNIEGGLDDHEDRLTVFEVESGQFSNPDQRALHLREVLLTDAEKSGGKAKLDRDAANGALQGGLTRDRVIDAMRRAADGDEADIDGTSKLASIDGIEFNVGRKRDQQSTVSLDLTQTSSEQLRRNPTTKDTSPGGR